MGEMLALTQDCIDFRSGNLTVWENDWQGNVGSTKDGNRRTIPMTMRGTRVSRSRCATCTSRRVQAETSRDADLSTKPAKSFGHVAPVRSCAIPHDAVQRCRVGAQGGTKKSGSACQDRLDWKP